MTNFGWWQKKAAEYGRFICMLCMDGFEIEDRYIDSAGATWADMCIYCGPAEEAALAEQQPGPRSGPSEPAPEGPEGEARSRRTSH